MAGKKGQTAVDGFEKIDLALDVLVRYVKKQPETRGINVLSSKVKAEIQKEKMRYLEEQTIMNADRKKTLGKDIDEATTLNKMKTEMGKINGLSAKKVRGKNRHLSQPRDRYQQATNHKQNKKTESKTKIISMNIKIQQLEKEKKCRDWKREHLQEKLQGMEIELDRRDLRIKHLEKRLESIRMEMTSEDERFRKKIEKKQLSKQRDELQQASKHETDQSRIINSLKKDNQVKDYHISELSEQLKQTMKIAVDKNAKMLNRQMVEIGKLNDRNEFLKQKMKEMDGQLHKQHDQLNRTLQTLRETESMASENKASLEMKIKSLERIIEHRDLHVKDLEEKVGSMSTELRCGNELLGQKLIAKDKQLSVIHVQLEEALNQLHETKSDQSRILTSLKNENMCLLAQVKLRDLKINNLEEFLESTITETKDTKERIAKETVQEKDNQISKLRDQQQHTLKTLQNREAELNEINTSLERRLNYLKSELQLRDQKIKQYEEISKGTNFKMTQISDRNEFLEIKLKEKDEHTDERDRTVERLQKSKTELVETIADLKKKNLDLEAHIKDSDLEVKDLEKRFNSMRTELKGANELLVNKMEEKDKDQRKQLQQANNQLYKREVELNEIIISLKKENQEEDYRKSKLNDQLKQTLKKLDDKEADMTEIDTSLNRKLEHLEAEVDRHERKVRHLEELLNKKKTKVAKVTERNKVLEKKLKEMDDQLREQNEQMGKKIQHLLREAEHRDRKVNDLEKMLHSKQVENREKEQEKNVRENNVKTSELKELLQQTLRKLHDTEIELDETKTRLSKAMGDRLTDNNPNITDLSDRNRPTKLAERCAELYDNQWTDAFDILDKYFDTEENVIEALLWILQDVMTFCELKAHRQMEELGRELIFAEKHESGDISADVRKLFKDCRKTVAPLALGNLYKMYVFHLRKSTDETLRTALEVSSYTSECLEICWFMVIQDPPVAFATLLRKGSSFNTDLYKPYTSSGTHIDYVVWPALLLHAGGPILAKGVAQGHGKKSKKST